MINHQLMLALGRAMATIAKRAGERLPICLNIAVQSYLYVWILFCTSFSSREKSLGDGLAPEASQTKVEGSIHQRVHSIYPDCC
ncbi:hypothetical protein GDO78_021458 [Eleutherodactylus coqui]|uniref:Uncharacterized protein n=1 Tax=Eleutherodactylus coqui TaxID=57060 RepID=A0A8J6E8A8_ELECQ|nr:hypothetical protein GDO78_021458 [Eleutherodactylus coqui]